jgi:uncharacterized protein (DUF849 family)
MPKLSEEQIADIKKRLRMLPIEFEGRISTLDKPLIIESACPGWQPKYWGPREIYPTEPPGYKEGGMRYPAVPISVEEQIQANVEAVKCGAAALHFHPRDPETGMSIAVSPKHEALHSKLMSEILESTFKEVDAVTLQHTWKGAGSPPEGYGGEVQSALAEGIDYISDMKQLLELGGGNKYCQGALVLWPPADHYPVRYDKAAQDAVRFMEENGVKPVLKFRGAYHVRKMTRVLMDTSVITQKPFLLVHDMGHPYGWPMDMDPWMPIDLISNIMQTKQRIPDSIIGVYSGGRNWLPITMTAILAGVDIVRVGIEDCYWMYPHRDDVIQSNIQAVKTIVDFAHMIGRQVANAQQAREILGIKLTSKS